MEEKIEEPKEEEVSNSSLVDEANKVAERIEAANKKQEELIERQEKTAINDALSGKSEAGKEPEKEKEETPKEYKDRVMNGKV